MRPVHAIVIRTAGTNCESEMVRAFHLAGAEPDLVHLDRVITRPEILEAADLIGFPGGFSYGDAVASGRLFAARVRTHLYPGLRRAAERGVPMIGACNGFQVLVQAGLLPGPPSGSPWPSEPGKQELSLSWNAGGRFVDRWVGIQPTSSGCVWTRDLPRDAGPDILQLPVAHAEGRLVATEATIAALEAQGQIALRYADNFNGSVDAIAGVCDPSGRILGLMPHPERYLDWSRHPYWTRLDPSTRASEPPGLLMFRSAVKAARAADPHPVT